jgi:hypothetical protein
MQSILDGCRPLVIVTLALGMGLGASSVWSGPEKKISMPGHARALSLVIEQRFGGPDGVTAEAEKRIGADSMMMRAWRVRAVEGQKGRFDVIFYIGDRPACVWKVDLSTTRVMPDGCSLEIWEDRQA